MPELATEHMQCMEVWGSNELTSRGVQMGGLDAWVYSKPYGHVSGETVGGGDIYYASSCATGRINRLMLADVSGHGNAVASTASSLRTLMRRYVNFLDQTEFVRSMNRQFSAMSTDGGFATAVVTTFFAPTNRLSICNAGHPQPLWYQARLDKWSLLSEALNEERGPRNIPLGILDLADYEQFDVEMEPGDLLICYTDALSEARDASGEMFFEAGLLEIARSLEAVPPEKFIETFLAAIAKHHPENLNGDDVTVLVLRPNGQKPHYTFQERLWAQIRLVGRLIRSINPRAERAPLPDMRLANVGGAMFPWLSKKWRATRARSEV